METVTLQKVNQNILKLHKELIEIKEEVKDLRDSELEVRPEYIKKLDKIEKGKFLTREKFDKEMADT